MPTAPAAQWERADVGGLRVERTRYSRDQRSGNKQVCIGLVCTPEGLPLSFETFAGNRAEVTTVEEIVAKARASSRM